MKNHLTQNYVNNLTLPQKKITIFDTDTKYLAIIARPTQAGYFCIKKIDGKVKYVKIGDTREITLKRAKELLITILDKITTQPKTEVINLTLALLHQQYIDVKIIKGHSAHGIDCALSRWRLHVPDDVKKSLVSSLTVADFEKIAVGLGQKGLLRTANLLIMDLAAAYNYHSKIHGEIANPLKAVTRFVNRQRERVLSDKEIQRFFKALEDSKSSNFADFIKVALFTGKRRSTVLSMRWDEVDFAKKIWSIPASKDKAGKLDIAILDDRVIDILMQRRKSQIKSSEWVFPSRDPRTHYSSPEKAWKNLLERANIQDVVMHDLRRTLASVMADANCSLHIIGEVLNHQSLAATPIYARVQESAKRQSLSLAVEEIALSAKLQINSDTEICRRINELVNQDSELAREVLSFINRRKMQKSSKNERAM